MSEVKQGTLKYYHRGLLHKRWKDYRFILYDSSLLTWYSDIKHKKPDGMVLLKDVERFICVGPYTRFLPDFPHLDNEFDQVCLIAFPMSIKDRDREVVWLLCNDLNELNSWMKAIVLTLPLHALPMERIQNISPSSSVDGSLQNTSRLQSPSLNSPEILEVKAGGIGLPLAAGLLGTRLQGHAMNTKDNPLQKAGYDYGNTLWGTGEGWGYFSPLEVPGFAGLGGSGCYSNHIDLIRDDNDEQRLKEVEDRIGEGVDDEVAVEEATYELSKNEIDDNEESDDRYGQDDEKSEESSSDNDDEIPSEIEEDLRMIDSDGGKEDDD